MICKKCGRTASPSDRSCPLCGFGLPAPIRLEVFNGASGQRIEEWRPEGVVWEKNTGIPPAPPGGAAAEHAKSIQYEEQLRNEEIMRQIFELRKENGKLKRSLIIVAVVAIIAAVLALLSFARTGEAGRNYRELQKQIEDLKENSGEVEEKTDGLNRKVDELQQTIDEITGSPEKMENTSEPEGNTIDTPEEPGAVSGQEESETDPDETVGQEGSEAGTDETFGQEGSEAGTDAAFGQEEAETDTDGNAGQDGTQYRDIGARSPLSEGETSQSDNRTGITTENRNEYIN